MQSGQNYRKTGQKRLKSAVSGKTTNSSRVYTRYTWYRVIEAYYNKTTMHCAFGWIHFLPDSVSKSHAHVSFLGWDKTTLQYVSFADISVSLSVCQKLVIAQTHQSRPRCSCSSHFFIGMWSHAFESSCVDTNSVVFSVVFWWLLPILFDSFFLLLPKTAGSRKTTTRYQVVFYPLSPTRWPRHMRLGNPGIRQKTTNRPIVSNWTEEPTEWSIQGTTPVSAYYGVAYNAVWRGYGKNATGQLTIVRNFLSHDIPMSVHIEPFETSTIRLVSYINYEYKPLEKPTEKCSVRFRFGLIFVFF